MGDGGRGAFGGDGAIPVGRVRRSQNTAAAESIKATPNNNLIESRAALLVIPVLITGICTSIVRREIPATNTGMTTEEILTEMVMG